MSSCFKVESCGLGESDFLKNWLPFAAEKACDDGTDPYSDASSTQLSWTTHEDPQTQKQIEVFLKKLLGKENEFSTTACGTEFFGNIKNALNVENLNQDIADLTKKKEQDTTKQKEITTKQQVDESKKKLESLDQELKEIEEYKNTMYEGIKSYNSMSCEDDTDCRIATWFSRRKAKCVKSKEDKLKKKRGRCWLGDFVRDKEGFGAYCNYAADCTTAKNRVFDCVEETCVSGKNNEVFGRRGGQGDTRCGICSSNINSVFKGLGACRNDYVADTRDKVCLPKTAKHIPKLIQMDNADFLKIRNNEYKKVI